MARTYPPADEVWDIRSRDPKPAMRVLGCFAETDVFVALVHGYRKNLGGPRSRQWRDLIESCKAEWRKLFPRTYPTAERSSMTTFRPTTSLCKPEGESRIPAGVLAYFQARNKNRVYELVLSEFVRSGISQATLARRLGKKPDVVCRWLGAPGNWTLDTVSDLLFAISGAEPEYSLSYPLDRGSRNFRAPEWLNVTKANTNSVIVPSEPQRMSAA